MDDVLDSLRFTEVYVPEVAASDAVAHGGSFKVLDPANGGKVDLFMTDAGDAFTESRIGRRIRAEVFGVECWVATAEDVVLAKLRWRLESRSEVQWRDCTEIAASNDLDLDYLRMWGAEIGVTGDLEALLDATGNAPT